MKRRTRRALSNEVRYEIENELKSCSFRDLASRANVSHDSLKRALAGRLLSVDTVRKLERIAPKVRRAEDFKAMLAVAAPTRKAPADRWTLEAIRSARLNQLLGNFSAPCDLAIAMRTDDAIFTARRNRLAPLAAIPSELVPHDSVRGAAVAARARAAVTIDQSVLKGLHATLVDHGVAIGYLEHDTNESGTQIAFRLTEWPLEHVRWDSSREVLTTATKSGAVAITHGDGRWVVFRDLSIRPWAQNACLLPASFVFPAHTQGVADWAASSNAHGLAKVVGELPEGVTLRDADGNLSPEADAFLDVLQGLVNGDRPAGVRPAGSKTDFLSNGSTAWQVFSEFTLNREKAAARIYTGTDAALGSLGGAPGVDISALFGVTTTILQGDTTTLENGINSGVLAPWTAINHGDSRLAPRYRFQLPDSDAERSRDQSAANWRRFHETLAGLRDQRIEITEGLVRQVANDFGIHPVPVLASGDTNASTIILAPTDVAKVVRVREARASQGLPPFGDSRDELTVSQFSALAEQQAQQ